MPRAGCRLLRLWPRSAAAVPAVSVHVVGMTGLAEANALHSSSAVRCAQLSGCTAISCTRCASLQLAGSGRAVHKGRNLNLLGNVCCLSLCHCSQVCSSCK